MNFSTDLPNSFETLKPLADLLRMAVVSLTIILERRMRLQRKSFAVLSVILTSSAVAAAEQANPLLHPLFSDRAVLQRDRPVPVWGWSTPGAEVRVQLSGPGLSLPLVTGTADEHGRWLVKLPPQVAGITAELRVSSGPVTASATNLIFGDVWLCGGQSNMEWTVKTAKDLPAEKSQANYPALRCISIAKTNSGRPQDLIRGAWKATTPDTVTGFTAVGYFFGRQLHQDLQVPIGLVSSNWGGTPGECWASAEALAALPDYAPAIARFQNLVQQCEEQRQRTGKEYPTLLTEWYQSNDPGSTSVPGWESAELDVSAWGIVDLPATLEDVQAIPADFDGTIWLRREFSLPETAVGRDAKLSFGPLTTADQTWVNGHKVGAQDTVYSRTYAVPRALLKPGSNSIAVRLLNSTGKTKIGDVPEHLSLAMVGSPSIGLSGKWKVKTGVNLRNSPPLPVRYTHVHGPSALYNGMIAPLVPMALTGAIWYQGESNVDNAFQYQSLLPAIIADWRGRFLQGDFPFGIVSLANFHERKEIPDESTWAELREAQAFTARRIPACGLAVTIDIGEADNIHFKNKQDVGRRLALWAEATQYGRTHEWSGPWYKNMIVDGSSIRVQFDRVGGGLRSADGKPLVGFSIAGEDRVFTWAEASIDGDTVVVKAPSVAKPVAVRYAWADNPACNLVNQTGLPAVPFRTDDWSRR